MSGDTNIPRSREAMELRAILQGLQDNRWPIVYNTESGTFENRSSFGDQFTRPVSQQSTRTQVSQGWGYIRINLLLKHIWYCKPVPCSRTYKMTMFWVICSLGVQSHPVKVVKNWCTLPLYVFIVILQTLRQLNRSIYQPTCIFHPCIWNVLDIFSGLGGLGWGEWTWIFFSFFFLCLLWQYFFHQNRLQWY